jgi:LCP family protein required for cell wall assembly
MDNQNKISNTQPNKVNRQDDLNPIPSQAKPNQFEFTTNPAEPELIFSKKTEPNNFQSINELSKSKSRKSTGSTTKPNDLRDQPFYLRKRPVKKKRSKRKSAVIILSSLCGLMLVLLLAVGVYIYWAISSGFTELSQSKLRSKAVNKEQDAFSILLLGTDERQQDSADWHPDSLMVAIVSPKTRSIQIISIPRDLKVKISTGEITKINQTATIANKHGLDPLKVTRETVENFLNIPIDYFVRVNFQSFEGIIDAVDGVTVNVERPFSAKMIGYERATFKKGINHLNGSQALTYSRERKQDPLGDIGRSKRQRQVVLALTEKLTKPSVLLALPEIASALSGNIKHNLKLSDFYTLAKIYQESKSNVQLLAFNSKSAEIGGDWYELWTSEERTTVSNTLQKQLEYKPIKPMEPSPLLEKEEQYASIDDDEDYPVFLTKLEKEKNKEKDNKKEKEKEKGKEEENKKEKKKENDKVELAEQKKEKKKVAATSEKDRKKGKLAENEQDNKDKSKVTITTKKPPGTYDTTTRESTKKRD